MDEESSKFAVVNDLFDVGTFNRWFDESRKLQQTLDPKRLATAKELGQDVFDALYKYTPEVRKPDDIDPAYRFNRSLIEKAMGTQEYEQLRSMTMLQEAESALATTTIAENLMKDLPEEDRKAVNDYAKAQSNLQQAMSQLQTLSQQAKLPSNLQKYQAQLQKQLPKLQQAAQQAQAGFNAACANPQVRAALRSAVGQALQEMNLANDFAGGWGLGPGQLQKIPVQDRLTLMRRIQGSAKIRELTKLMGRFKRLAFQRRYTRPTTEPNEVVDVTVGDDLARVLPSEVVKLTDEIRAAETTIRQRVSMDAQAELLTSIPGVGPLIAMVILAEIGEVTRFPDANHLVSYAGLAPRVRSSGGRTRLGGITKQGSSALRWALVEAAIVAVRRPGRLQEMHKRLRQGKSAALAMTACARQLLVVIYHMLTRGDAYQPAGTRTMY